jgi:sporulation protein YlmC with PRC-barrel domain
MPDVPGCLSFYHMNSERAGKEKVTMMDIPVNAEIGCTDGTVGRSTHIVLNPKTKEVTHVVVKEQGFMGFEHLVPVDQIAESTPTSIHLRCTKGQLVKMEVFNETEYVPSTMPHYVMGPGPSQLEPLIMPESRYYVLEHEHVPPGELAIRRGTKVEATDGRVGQVDELLVDSANDHITHLVLREGHLWGQKDVTIPVSEIDRIGEDTVYLKIDKQRIEELPTVPVHHFGR